MKGLFLHKKKCVFLYLFLMNFVTGQINTEDAAVNSKGDLAVETFSMLIKTDELQQIIAPKLQLRYGINNWLEIRANTQLQFDRD